MKIVGLPSTQLRPMTSDIPMDMKHLGSWREEEETRSSEIMWQISTNVVIITKYIVNISLAFAQSIKKLIRSDIKYCLLEFVSDPLCNGLLNLAIGFPGTGHEVAQKREKPNRKSRGGFCSPFCPGMCFTCKKPWWKKNTVGTSASLPMGNLRLFLSIGFQSSRNEVSAATTPYPP